MQVSARAARRALLTLGWCSALGAFTLRARADETSAEGCVRPRSVTVNVAPFTDAAAAPRLASMIRAELTKAMAEHCWELPAGADGPALSIEVRWPDETRARVLVVGVTQERVHYAIRDLDLQRLPKDGIPLAVAIAADELLETISEQAAQLGPLPPSIRAAPPPPPPPPPPARPAPRRLSFGPAGAIDILGSDAVLIGPDARLLVPFARSLVLAFRVGSRVSTDRSTRGTLRASSAWLAGGALHVGPESPRASFSVSAGVDAMRVRIVAASDAATKTLALGRVGLASSVTIGAGFRLSAEAYVGGVLSSTEATIGTKPAQSFGEGLAAGGSIGLGALF